MDGKQPVTKQEDKRVRIRIIDRTADQRIPGLLPVAVFAHGGEMLLHFSAIGDALMTMHSVPADLRNAMMSRIKNFQVADFPLGERKRGKAELGLDDTLKIVFAFELLDAGLAPARVIRLTETDWPLIRRAIAGEWWKRNDGSGSSEPFAPMLFAPHAMAEFGSKELLRNVGLSEALERGTISGPNGRRLLLSIDVGATADAFGLALARGGTATIEDFGRAMQMLCADVFGTKDEGRWREGKRAFATG